ncbi:MAG: ribosome assembly cofactor RimP [Tannerella sp.]|nr:ribosome assembly cofactor RimP [Tannerella sp.]
MIEKDVIIRLAEAHLATSECYLVDVSTGPDNRIVVEIDHDRAVGIDDCAALSRYIEERLDREVEDFELEVGSAGIFAPFKIMRQYVKNRGNEVEMLLVSGEKRTGTLQAADEQGVTLLLARTVKPEGAKRKVKVFEEQRYAYSEIKYTKNKARFK